MATVGTLLIDIAANTAKLAQDMETAKSTVEKAMKGIESAAGIAKTALGALGIGASVAGIKAFVTSTAEAVGALKTLSDQTGVSVERLSAFRTVAKYADTDMASVATGIQKLSKTMMEAATAGGMPAKVFQAIGVSATDATGQLRNADVVMQDVARVFVQMGNETERVALAQQLFGKAGAQLLPFLLDLGKAGELNAKVTTEQAQAAKDFDDNLKRLKSQSEAWKVELVNGLIPTLNTFLEQMLEGKKIAGGLLQALGLFGTINPFRSTSDSVKSLRAELESLQGDRARYQRSNADTSAIDMAIEGVKKKLEFAKFMQRQEVLGRTSDADLDARDLRLRQKLSIKLPDETPKPAKPDKFDALVEEGRSLEMQNRMLDEAREYGAKYLLGEQKKIDAAQMLAAELAGELNPALAEFNKVQERVNQAVEAGTLGQEQADAVLQQAAIRYQEAVSKADAYRNMLEALAKSYGTLLTPQEKYAKAIGDIATLQAAGKMDAEQAERQRTKAAEDLAKAVDGVASKTKEADDMARQLGMTFSSAFEDAVLKGKKARDILQGVLQDVARIMLRTQVTQPAANWIGGLVKAGIGAYFGPSASTVGVSGVGVGDMAGGSFADYAGIVARAGGGPVDAGMPYLVGENGPELVVPNSSGTVVPNDALGSGVTVYQMIQISTGVAATVRQEIASLLPKIQAATVSAVIDARRRGGPTATAFA